MSEQDSADAAGMGDAEGQPQYAGDPAGEMTPEQQAEMQQRMEEQLRQIRVQDVVAESAVSIINLTARRIGKEDERDLEQGRIGIEAVRALAELVEGELQTQLRSALSEIQMMYAKASGSPMPSGSEAPPQGPGAPQTPGAVDQGGQPATEPPPRLWTPGR